MRSQSSAMLIGARRPAPTPDASASLSEQTSDEQRDFEAAEAFAVSFGDDLMRLGEVERLRHLLAYVELSLTYLSRRCGEVEATPRMKYAGVWQPGGAYEIGDVVSFGGSMWIATQPNRGVKNVTQPSGSDCWTLVVKRGRDGKHASK